MHRTRCAKAFVVFPMLLSASGVAQQPAAAPITKLSQFEINQFISSSGPTPRNVIDLDNNGQILLVCVAGTTRGQLQASGLAFAESQIHLLKTWRLLRENDGVLRTAFPILQGHDAQRLRSHSSGVAAVLGRDLEPDVAKLVSQLEAVGRRDNAYTILFSYALDDLAWRRFREGGRLRERVLTADAPFWAGEVWAIYPPRDLAMGTNSISEKGVSLKVSWTERAIPRMLPFVADLPTLVRLFEDYVNKGRVEDIRARTVFAPFHLFDAAGRLTVPVIDAAANDSLHQSSEVISAAIAEKLPTLLDLDGLTAEFKFRDGEQALVVFYHELMWDLMDYWESKGIIRRPAAFVNPASASAADIAALVFVVRAVR